MDVQPQKNLIEPQGAKQKEPATSDEDKRIDPGSAMNKKRKISHGAADAPQNVCHRHLTAPPVASRDEPLSNSTKGEKEPLGKSYQEAESLEVFNRQLKDEDMSTSTDKDANKPIQEMQSKNPGTLSELDKYLVRPFPQTPEALISLPSPNNKNSPHKIGSSSLDTLLKRASLIDKHDVLLNDKHATKYSSGSILWLDAKKRERSDALTSNCSRSLAQRFDRVREIFKLSLPSDCTPRFWRKLNDSEMSEKNFSDDKIKLGRVEGYKGLYVEKNAEDAEIRHNVKSFRLSKTSLHPSTSIKDAPPNGSVPTSSTKASSNVTGSSTASKPTKAVLSKEIISTEAMTKKDDAVSTFAREQRAILDLLDTHWNPDAQIVMTAGELARCLIENANLTAAAAIKRVLKQYPQASQNNKDNNWTIGKNLPNIQLPRSASSAFQTTKTSAFQAAKTSAKPPTNTFTSPIPVNPSPLVATKVTPLPQNTHENNVPCSSATFPSIIHDWDILLNDKHATKYSLGSELWAKAKADERSELMRRNLVEKRARVQEIFEKHLLETYNVKRTPIFWYKMINNEQRSTSMHVGQIAGRETNIYRKASEEEIRKNVKSYRGTNRTSANPNNLDLVNSIKRIPPAPEATIQTKIQAIEISNTTNVDKKSDIPGSQGQPFSSKTGETVKEVRMSTYTHPNGKSVFMESIQLIFHDGSSTERFGGIPQNAGAGSQLKQMTFKVDDKDAIIKTEVSSGWGTHGVKFSTKNGIVSPWYGSDCGPKISIYDGHIGQQLCGITGCSGWLLDKLEFVFGNSRVSI